MSKFKIVFLSISTIIGLIVIAFTLELGGLQWNKFFAPKHEDVRREVFESTRSYNQGKIQELAKLKQEYDATQDEQDKMALIMVIRHKFADYDESKLPTNLRLFLIGIRGY